jgi:hypothetical protein
MNSIIVPSEFDISKLTYGEIKRMDNGGKMVSIGYNKQPLVIQTCECYAPFGLQCYQNDDGKAPSYSLDLSFKDMDKRKPLKQLFDVFTQLDAKNIEVGMENAMTWLSQKKPPKSTDVIEALYTPIVKVASDEKYPSTFKFKLPYRNGGFACDVYDKNHNLIDISKLEDNKTKGSKCTALLQCTGIWVAASKFGMSWKCIQVKCCVRETFTGFCMKHIPNDNIVGEDIDEDEEVNIVTKSKPDVKKEVVKESTGEEDDDDDEKEDDDEDDDDDDEDDDEDDDDPTPVIVNKKKK